MENGEGQETATDSTQEHYGYTETINAVSKSVGVPVNVVRRIYEATMDIALESLKSDRRHWNFGKAFTLELRDIAEGKVRNPRAKPGDPNEFYLAPARKKLRVRAGKTWEDDLKEFFDIGESVLLEPEEGEVVPSGTELVTA